MNGIIAKPLLVLCLVTLMTGCKIEIIVPSGGDVISSDTSHSCAKGMVCEFVIDSDQLPFNESFTAEPRPGYIFEKWADGTGFMCAKSTNPVCTVEIADDAFGATVVTLFQSAYLMPIFKDVGLDFDGDGIRNELDEDDDGDGVLDIDDSCPLNPDLSCDGNTRITVNGKTWYQPDLFLGITQSEIEAVCPGVICEGVINGYNLTGWAWATNQEVIDLLEYYGTLNTEQECPMMYSLFQDGWRETNTPFVVPTRLVGLTRDSAMFISPSTVPCSYDEFPFFGPISDPTIGAFFYMPSL
jgi:hypothetical protein